MHISLGKERVGIISAILAAILVAISVPLCKIYISESSPVMMAGLLNVGAGIGVALLWGCMSRTKTVRSEQHLKRADTPWMIGICVTDIGAAISMMAGLALTSAANASLLQNFETVVTAVFALILFKELISFRLWIGIVLITLGSLFLTFEDPGTFTFSPGSLLVLLACVLWGLENNFTKKVADRNPFETVVLKCLIAGGATLLIGLLIGEQFPAMGLIIPILILGLLGYGLNIIFLVIAERHLGAARACTIYGINPFLAAILACLIFADVPSGLMIPAAVLMFIGFYFASSVKRKKLKKPAL